METVIQAQIESQREPLKPLGNFEIAPEFNTDKQPLDVVYEHRHALYVSDFEGAISIASTVLRGISKPQGYVDLVVVEGNECINLSYSPGQARTLANLLLAAAADADAALAQLVANKEGGAA
ncbi:MULTISPECIES: hypothetical protein [Comamonas]|uniref:hypothetical protein n=1 Tax=Comamonas TaxID=283 RepID=UPI00257C10DA|nr:MULTISPECIES: hypothetical protein [Comamonas]